MITIIGTIDDDTFRNFDEALREYEEKRPDEVVEVLLSSGGGETYVGLAFYSRIINSPCKIKMTVFGHCMSAATVIFAAADVRIMSSEAWFMVHDDTRDLSGRTSEVTGEFRHAEEIESQWAIILARHSEIDSCRWREMSAKTTYLSAKNCLALGLVHEIIK